MANNSMVSVIVDETQFYEVDNFELDDAPVYSGDPIMLKKFKTDIKKVIPNIVILNHGAGEIEFIMYESDYARFQITANMYKINLENADVVEM